MSLSFHRCVHAKCDFKENPNKFQRCCHGRNTHEKKKYETKLMDQSLGSKSHGSHYQTIQPTPRMSYLKGIINHDKGDFKGNQECEPNNVVQTFSKSSIKHILPQRTHKYTQPCQSTDSQCLGHRHRRGFQNPFFFLFSDFFFPKAKR